MLYACMYTSVYYNTIYTIFLIHLFFVLFKWLSQKKDKLDGSFKKLIFFSIYLEKLWYIGICFLCWSTKKKWKKLMLRNSYFIYTLDLNKIKNFNQYKKHKKKIEKKLYWIISFDNVTGNDFFLSIFKMRFLAKSQIYLNFWL